MGELNYEAQRGGYPCSPLHALTAPGKRGIYLAHAQFHATTVDQ